MRILKSLSPSFHSDQTNNPKKTAKNKPESKAADHFSQEGLLSAAVNFVETKGKNTGLRFLQELNVNDINRHRKTDAERMLNLSEGTALFLAFDRRIYNLEDPYVKNAEIRSEVSKELMAQNPGQEVMWLESAGVAEPGGGFFATVPVCTSHGATITAGFGFSVGTILRYRTSVPVIGDKKEYIKPTAMPFNADAARLMCAGQEFEICGQGKVRGDANVGIRYGAGVGFCTAGIGENIGSQVTSQLEYGLNIMSLNGSNIVRVTIRKINQESIAAVSNTAAGLIIPPNKLFPGNFGVPQFGHGLLKYFAEHKGPPNFEAYLTDYTALTLNCSLTHTHKGLHIRSYDLDLNNPSAAKAYESLMRLDVSHAEDLAEAHDGVVKVELNESTNSNKAAMRLALCTEKLWLKEALKSESHGELINAAGQHKIYRDKAYKNHYENFLTGRHDALWESVNIKIDKEPAKTYYHFNYQKNDFITHQHEIDEFFDFAHAVGITSKEETKKHVVSMPMHKKILSSADDSKFDVDLYFTAAGVELIKNTSHKDLAQAYLATSGELNIKLALHPMISGDEKLKAACESIYERYQMYRYTHPFIRTKHQINGHELKRLAKDYLFICGRDLNFDFRALKKAKRFAELSQTLLTQEEDRHKIGKFFTSLGQNRLSYAQSIATLVKIAGRQNVLVHTLAASGGGVALKSNDEGALVHPRNELVKQVLRKA